MKELYLNGTKVDFSDSFELTRESNLFRSVDDLTANHTSTITLPLSDTNKAFFGQFQIPTMQGANIRQWIRCTYINDGVTIIEDGRAVLMSADADGYSVTVVWGAQSLTKIKNDGLKLPQLPTSDAEAVTLQINNPLNGRGFGAYGFSELYTGWDGDATTPARLPCVRVKWVLDKICDRYGIKITPDAGRSTRLSLLTMPLVTSRRYYETEDHSNQIFSFTWNYVDIFSGYFFQPTLNAGQTVNGLFRGCDPEGGASVGNYKAMEAKGDVTLHIPTIRGSVVAHGDTSPNISYNGSEGWTVVMAKGDRIRIEPTSALSRDPIVVSGWYESNAPLFVGDKYPIVANLPDITCIEFIKEICAQLGVWAFQRDASTVELVSLDAITEKNQIQEVKAIKVQTLSPRQEGWARSNVLKYASDDYSVSDYASAITVEDATLDAETTLFESKFAGMQNNFLPLWEVETDADGVKTATLRNLAPRIGVEVGTSTSKVSGASWEQIKQYYYRTYQALASTPLVATIQTLLRPSEVKSLKLDAPVRSELTPMPGVILNVTGNKGDIYNLKTILYRPSYQFAPDYIASGLDFHLDGKNRGGVAGRWADTVQGCVFTLLNTYTELSDGVKFTSNGYGYCSDQMEYLSNECTLEVVINDWVDHSGIWFFNNSNNCVASGLLNTTRPLILKTVSPRLAPIYPISIGERVHTITVTPSGAYYDGVALVAVDNTFNNWGGTTARGGLYLGARPSGNFCACSIHEVRIYNRELSEQEIKQNYFVDKIRYNG